MCLVCRSMLHLAFGFGVAAAWIKCLIIALSTIVDHLSCRFEGEFRCATCVKYSEVSTSELLGRSLPLTPKSCLLIPFIYPFLHRLHYTMPSNSMLKYWEILALQSIPVWFSFREPLGNAFQPQSVRCPRAWDGTISSANSCPTIIASCVQFLRLGCY